MSNGVKGRDDKIVRITCDVETLSSMDDLERIRPITFRRRRRIIVEDGDEGEQGHIFILEADIAIHEEHEQVVVHDEEEHTVVHEEHMQEEHVQ